MIQRRSPDDSQWAANADVRIADAADLQTLLEALVLRYRLIGAVVATTTGDVLARVGGSLEEATDGFEAALAGERGSLTGLAEAIDGKILPRYFSQGETDAYADKPTPETIALFMRKRAPANERSELQMVSDYGVAKEIGEELRNGMHRLRGGG